MTYQESLRDPRWQRKRLEILQAANFRCEDCGAGDRTLDVHHNGYIRGMDAWEYGPDLLMCLCQNCHGIRQGLEDSMKVSIARITRFIPLPKLEEEAWRIIGDVSERQTARYAAAFSA